DAERGVRAADAGAILPRRPAVMAVEARPRVDDVEVGSVVAIIATVVAAARIQVVGVDPAVDAALRDGAPGTTAVLDVDALAGVQHVDDRIAGAGASPHVHRGRGIGGGGGRRGGARQHQGGGGGSEKGD